MFLSRATPTNRAKAVLAPALLFVALPRCLRSKIILLALVSALIAVAPTGSASAAQIAYLSVTGIWHDPTDNVPGSQPGDPVITNGTPTSIIRWGTTSGTPQSGYDFTATVPPPFTFPGPIPFFSLGTFTHRNFAVSDPSLTSVQLDVVLMLSIDGVPTGPLTFTYTFNHEETPNNAMPCPYPTPPGEGCTDRVTIVSSAQPTTFQVDGVDLTLSMSFLVNGSPVSEYITREGGVLNSSGLVGEFTLPPGTPALTVTKSGPATMNPAEAGDFVIDAQNTGVFPAFNATLVDRLPDGPTGGMCDTVPQVLSARVFASDGVTPVPGKGPLIEGSDYALAYDGTACELTFNALSAASVIGVSERLVITYRTQLDAGTQYGITLTNVAGATEWYNGPDTVPTRTLYTRIVTDGTVGTADHEDAHTVTVVPLLYAEKAAALQVDAMSPGIVDPGDVLRYTIRIHNNGQMPVTQATLRDQVPANTTYVADSMTLNGEPVGRPDGGVSPLIAGIDVSSSDLTPPLPGAGAGILSGGEMAVIEFDLRVNDGVPPGTVIANQATVTSAEVPNLLTDGDGNPATGPEPTVVVVGNLQELKITKAVSVVGGGPAIAGATLEYVLQATNVGTLPAYAVVIRDDIAVPMPYLSFVDQSWSLNGSTNGITVTGSLITADYSTMYGPLQPGRTITLRFRAVLDPNLAVGTRVTNTGTVYWNDPVQTASASVSIDVGGTPGVGLLSGQVWHDANFDAVPDNAERKLEGWIVELYLNGSVAYTTRTDADGRYRIGGVEPNYGTTDQYELRFSRPSAGPTTALLGRAHSDFTDGLQRISDIVVLSGSNLIDLNLPIDPNGIVYDSISRAPIAGATLTLLDSTNGTALPTACFYDAAQQDQVTLADGYYKFDLNFSSVACPSGGNYLIRVTPPSTSYIAGYSELIPPTSSDATPAFSVPACPASIDDAVPATQRCESAPSELQPAPAVAARSAGTRYYMHLTLDDSLVPGSSQIFNNHIPLDLDLDQSVTITKSTPLVNVTRGQLVPYVITVANGVAVNLADVNVVDRMPPDFRYVAGSARLDGVAAEPTVNGRDLVWAGLSITADGHHTLKLLLAVGAGVAEGEFVNRAQAMHAITGNALSAEASATVRIVPDPSFDCTDVIGKVFDDANRNGLQDGDERGIAGARLVTTNGLLATTDAYGRFHITCAITPREGRGSNFVLKLDDRTLPSGYRISTQPLQIQRATRGKALEFNFGASIHRVVGLDLSDPVFEPDSTVVRELWRSRVNLLLDELRRAPAVLHLTYLADLEDPRLVDQRVRAMKKELASLWTEQNGGYPLVIEHEVFWRRGAPPDAGERRSREEAQP
jgi:large repetitive protein